MGFAFGEVYANQFAHVNIVYVRPERRREGITKALLAEFAERAKAGGAEHITPRRRHAQRGRAEVWQRLELHRMGAARSSVPVETPGRGVSPAPSRGESYGSLHVQTDDAAAVRTAVGRVPPALRRLRRAPGLRAGATAGSPSTHEARRQRPQGPRAARLRALERDRGGRLRDRPRGRRAVVRYALFERGSIVDEYQSVPEFWGPLPPGDVVALGANPTVVSRLHRRRAGPCPSRRAHRLEPRRAAASAGLFAQLAELLGLEGAGRG